jgi:hypothetical protein
VETRAFCIYEAFDTAQTIWCSHVGKIGTLLFSEEEII